MNFTLKGWYLKKYSLNNLYIVAKQYHLGENWQKAWLKKGWLVQGTGNEILRFYQYALFWFLSSFGHSHWKFLLETRPSNKVLGPLLILACLDLERKFRLSEMLIFILLLNESALIWVLEVMSCHIVGPQRACIFLNFCWCLNSCLVWVPVKVHIKSYGHVTQSFCWSNLYLLCGIIKMLPGVYMDPKWISLTWDQPSAVKLKLGSLALMRFCSEFRCWSQYLDSKSPAKATSKLIAFCILN